MWNSWSLAAGNCRSAVKMQSSPQPMLPFSPLTFWPWWRHGSHPENIATPAALSSSDWVKMSVAEIFDPTFTGSNSCQATLPVHGADMSMRPWGHTLWWHLCTFGFIPMKLQHSWHWWPNICCRKGMQLAWAHTRLHERHKLSAPPMRRPSYPL